MTGSYRLFSISSAANSSLLFPRKCLAITYLLMLCFFYRYAYLEKGLFRRILSHATYFILSLNKLFSVLEGSFSSQTNPFNPDLCKFKLALHFGQGQDQALLQSNFSQKAFEFIEDISRFFRGFHGPLLPFSYMDALDFIPHSLLFDVIRQFEISGVHTEWVSIQPFI